MKNLSKALALFVVVAMMLTSVVSVAAFTDVTSDTLYASEIDVIAALGLIQGYEDGSFQPEGSITRAEFATIVVRMLGQESQAAGSAAATKFADVPADHWAAGYVNIANSLGIINGYGDGNFGPEDPVLYEQAVKMLVCAMGYGKEIDASGYPVAYLTQASSIGITNGANGENGVAANRGLVAKLVYNSLDKPLMKTQGYGIYAQSVICDGSNDTVKATILDEYLDIVKLSVIVADTTATSSTTNKTEKVTVTVVNNYKSRYGEANDEDTFEKGANQKIAVGDTNASEFVGTKAVIYVAYEDGYIDDAEIVYIAADASSSSETLTSVQIEDAPVDKGNYFLVEYRETPSDRITQSFTVTDLEKNGEPVVSIYVNGVKTDDKLDKVLGDKFYGKVEFTNNDTNNEYDYDTVFVTNYETIVVDSVNTKTSRVSSKNANSLAYDNAEGTVKATLYAADGSEMNWADLQEWDVVSYTKTTGTATTVIVGYVVDAAVTGKVSGISGDEYIIGDGEYNIVDKYIMDGDIALGDEGTYYLDIMGNIVWYNADSPANTNYGYIKLAKVYDGGFTEEPQLRMFAYDGTIANYDLYSTVRYNGKAMDEEDIAALADDATDEIAELTDKFVVFKTNANAEITSIDTPETWTAMSKASDFTIYGEETAESTYAATTGGLDVTGKSRVYVTEATKIFVLGTKEAEYELLDMAALSDEDVLKEATFYNVDDDLNVGAILVKGGITSSDVSSTPIAVAVGTGLTTDSEGYEIVSLTAFSELATTTFVTDSQLSTITKDTAPVAGTVYIPKYTNGGAVKSVTEYMVTTTNTVAANFDADEDYGTTSTTVKFYADNVKDVNAKRITLADNTDLVIPATANVYVVDGRIKTVKNRVSEGDIGAVEWVEATDDEAAHWDDGGADITDYVLFAREVNGRIADVVLYINYDLVVAE